MHHPRGRRYVLALAPRHMNYIHSLAARNTCALHFASFATQYLTIFALASCALHQLLAHAVWPAL